MKPILRWVGGKTRILDDVFKYFPTKVHNYHEIFLGGGSVLLKFLELVENKKITCSGKIHAYDFNKALIYVYINLQKDPISFSKSLVSLCKKFNNELDKEKFFYNIRDKYNKLINSKKEHLLCTSVLFVFLNKTCYGGLYRAGPKGFNVSFSFCDSIDTSDLQSHFNSVSRLIKNVHFHCSSFQNSLKSFYKNDFVYLDPPYVPITATSFVGYTSDGFDADTHNKLFQKIKSLRCHFLMSNSNAPIIYKCFPRNQFSIRKIDCRRSIACTSSVVKEVLVKPKT